MLRSLPTAAEPAATPISTVPADYMERVRQTHQQGGYGSLGYGYDWKIAEAEKNLLRTHTTAVSSRMLYRLAQVCAACILYGCCELLQLWRPICDRLGLAVLANVLEGMGAQPGKAWGSCVTLCGG